MPRRSVRGTRAAILALAVIAAACGGSGNTGTAPSTAAADDHHDEAGRNMVLLAHLDVDTLVGRGAAGAVHARHDEVGNTHGTSASGNWGYTTPDKRRLALTGTSEGLSIVEVTDPSRPVVVALIAGENSPWREVKTYRHWAYVTTEAKTGLDIVDLRDPSHPVKVRTWSETFTSAHTLWIDEERGLLYANGTSNGMRVLDLEPDPESPRDLGGFDGFYVHDAYARGDVLFAAAINDGFLGLLDVGDPGRIIEIDRFFTGGRFTHNAWPTDDGRYVFTTDERPRRPIEGWDLRQAPPARKVSEYIARPDGLPHNVMVDGDRLVLSHYTDGVRLLDIRDPERPVEIGFYDTFDGVAEGFDGAWGAYIFPASDLILVSDISGGLFVVQYTGGLS
jgi:choice-of-anchor B domain-containing protein